MKQYFVVAAMLAVMMSFQNCGKAGTAGLSGSEDPNSLTPVVKIKADEFSSLVMTDSSSATFWDIDLTSGQIHGFDDRGIATGAHHCLGERDRLQLDELLKTAEVCQPVSQVPQGENCTMIYQYPYAQLKSAGREVNLGEKRNGCEIPVDICGAQAGQLKSLVASLLTRVESMSCN